MASEDGPIDLHIHSVFSDGSLSPIQIIEKALRQGLCAISITDHDTVEGCREALEQGVPEALGFAAGVEISAGLFPPFESSGTFHLLGYFIDPANGALSGALSDLQEARRERNPQIIERLRNMGIPIRYEDAVQASGGGQVGRPHIARALLVKGVVRTTEEAFNRYIGNGGPAYVEKRSLPAGEAIALIRGAGGLPVLAHPSSLRMDGQTLAVFVRSLADMGLGGLEAFYPGHGPDTVKKYRRLASDLSLAVTGGSDFHGDYKPRIEMGRGTGDLWVPYSIFKALKKAHGRYAKAVSMG